MKFVIAEVQNPGNAKEEPVGGRDEGRVHVAADEDER